MIVWRDDIWMDVLRNDWMDGKMDGWIYGWMNRCMGMDGKILQVTVESIRRGTFTQVDRGGGENVRGSAAAAAAAAPLRHGAKCSFKTA